jgi:parvulin-like peptidyl-prolyl isomerase
LADEILVKLKEGASFAQMASIYSDSMKEKGGDRGWIDRTLFKKELSDPAFALKAGQVSDVIDLPEACYLIQVEEVKAAHVKPLADVREEIEKTLKVSEQGRLKSKWIDRLKAKSFIRYF